MKRRKYLGTDKSEYQQRAYAICQLILSCPNLVLMGTVASLLSGIFSPIIAYGEEIEESAEDRLHNQGEDIFRSDINLRSRVEQIQALKQKLKRERDISINVKPVSQKVPTARNLQTRDVSIQPFQPNADIKLPASLEKLTADSQSLEANSPAIPAVRNLQTPSKPESIQPFQPNAEIKLPASLEKLTADSPQNTPTANTPKTSTAVTQNNSTSQPTIQILSPSEGGVIDIPATTVVIQYTAGKEIELRVNGKLVDKSLIGRTEVNGDVITQTWYGVSLQDGENKITAQIVGASTPPSSINVTLRGAPTKMSIQTREARIPADGRSLVNISGRLVDENGNRSNRDTIITLSATAGEFIGNDFKPDSPGFQVEVKNGEFSAQLKSGLNAQTARIRAVGGDNLEAFTQVQFVTSLRPSLVTGVIDLRLGARSTDYYGSLRDFLRPRPETSNDVDDSTRFDVRSSIFATGAVGEWLFTGAYNSDRNLNEDCNCDTRLFRNYQFDEQNYPVYGDSSQVAVVTPSIDSVFARFERSSKIPGADPDYIMWGDYNTEELARTSQQFTSLTRQLHGLKLNYNLGNLQFTGLYGNNVAGFQRDTIAPDGTSGFYFLSRRLVQPGSEVVFLETEELNRPGTVIERRRLNIGQDYQIDYDRGTLLFTEPLRRTDIGESGEVLVQRIVVTYQEDLDDANGDIYAGRLQYNIARGTNQDSWVAASYLQENQGTRDFELYGADAMFSFGSGRLMAEYARSNNTSEIMGDVSGEAMRVEAQAQLFPGIQARAYYRYADTGFANNATISFVPGQTRYGAQVTGKITNTTSLRAQYDREDNFGVAPQPLDTFEELFAPRREALPGSRVDNSLTTMLVGVQQRFGQTNLELDWVRREREDRINDTFSGSSDQLRSRLNVPISKNLSFLAQNELTLSSQVDAVYNDRTAFGLNWALTPGVNLTLSQQFYTRGQFDGQAITSLGISGEHKLGEDTTITGRYSILGAASEMTGQGAIGINNRWKIAPGLRLNLGYERVFGDFFGKTAAGNQFAQPFAVGQSAYAIGFNGGDSYNVGLEYTDNPNFKASAQYQYRTSSAGSNTVITAGALGKITPSLSALLRYQQAGSSNQRLAGLGDTANLKVGLAYRDPNSDKFNALLRYEYRKNPSSIPETLLIGSGTGVEDHTFALETIYAPNWRWEIYGKYALRNTTTYLAQDLAGTGSVNLAQARLTYRTGYSTDVVGEARWINQGGFTETGFVVEGGYYLTPTLRLAAGYVFGKVDDRDFSGTRSAGGPYLGFTVKIDELFGGFGRQKIAPPQQQESLVKKLRRIRTKAASPSISLAEKLRQFKAEELRKVGSI